MFLLPASGAATGTPNSALIEANRLAARNQFEPAEAKYKIAIAAEPKNSMCYHMYGRTLALAGRLDDALKQYRKALELAPQNPELYNDIGVALAFKGNPSSGARFIKHAVTLRPNYVTALNNLGAALTKLGDYKQAVDSFNASLALQRNPVIQSRVQEATSRMEKSKTFEFGPPPSIDEDFSKAPAVAAASNTKDPAAHATKAPISGVSTNINDAVPDDETLIKEAQEWLQEAKPLFQEVKATGFQSVEVTGQGMIQIGDTCQPADQVQILPLNGKPVEIAGDVLLSCQGEGEISLGNAKVKSYSSEGRFNIDSSQGLLTCRAGSYEVSGWSSVNVLRDGGRVQVTAEYCKKVYGQDDAMIKASHCGDVSLVTKSSGTILDCANLMLNDNARAMAVRCREVNALGGSTVKIFQCGEVIQQGDAKVEFANSAKY